MTTTKHKVKFGAGANGGRKRAAAAAPGRLPRVTKLMALAIRLDQLIRDGVVADQAEIARLGYVSRARLTQIMDLLLLAPDIQEAILLLQGNIGREAITERDLRRVVAATDWKVQRTIWQQFVSEPEKSPKKP